MKKAKIYILPLLLISFLYSCNESGNFYDNSQNISQGWSLIDTISFDVNKEDVSDKKYNIFFVIRNNNDYPYRNIYLITTVTSPRGAVFRDTLEYQLAAADGKWLGDGMGAVKQNKLIYKKNYSLIDSGNYKFDIIHGMRKDTLKGIEGLSLLIDEIKNGKN